MLIIMQRGRTSRVLFGRVFIDHWVDKSFFDMMYDLLKNVDENGKKELYSFAFFYIRKYWGIVYSMVVSK